MAEDMAENNNALSSGAAPSDKTTPRTTTQSSSTGDQSPPSTPKIGDSRPAPASGASDAKQGQGGAVSRRPRSDAVAVGDEAAAVPVARPVRATRRVRVARRIKETKRPRARVASSSPTAAAEEESNASPPRRLRPQSEATPSNSTKRPSSVDAAVLVMGRRLAAT